MRCGIIQAIHAEALFGQALALNARWLQVPFHGALELEMPDL